ncbi:hypothetical protein RGQ13_02175 [Thalassotalea psychrophila]|uniref:Ferric oxidoreductase domain-containing protein n=1 Tax=Thalassotalea psychrophila TaxID=3065647 RepID=A0ABY9TVJ0_9GAMM|nr:hypothetical protein RGQ13_02175 [Colwelliaceae bacterium SQ149]
MKTSLSINKIFLICFFVSLVYAVIRYHVYNDISWLQLPLWTTNKACGVTALMLIGLSVSLPNHHPRRKIGLFGVYIALLHVLLSLILLKPAYYPKFFLINEQFSLVGELAILAGILSFAVLIIAVHKSYPKFNSAENANLAVIKQCNIAFLLFSILHMIAMATDSWFSISNWPGYLPPISMLSALLCCYFLLYLRIKK